MKTLSTLAIFVLNMVRNPDVQEKGRRELDAVISRDRLPNLQDRPNLPYLNRIFYETARYVNCL
jgi:cytochrome P450